MSAEQKKTGGRIKRNLPSMPAGSDDMEEIENGEAEELLAKPFVYNKKPAGTGELVASVRAALALRKASETPNEESPAATPITDDDDEVADEDENEPDEVEEADAEDGDDDDDEEPGEDDGDDEEEDGDDDEDEDDDDKEGDSGDDGDAEEGNEEEEGNDEDDDVKEVEEDEPVAMAVDVEEESESVVGTDPDAIPPGQDFADSRFARRIAKDRGTYVPVWVKRICGNGNDMLVLAQLVFWFQQGKNGKIRANKLLKSSPNYWVAKSYGELGRETGLKPCQVRHAIKHLTDAGYVIKENHPFQNLKTNHFRLDPHAIAQKLSMKEAAE